MFHFTNKHSERETDHVVFAFHLHVPCSETVLASRLVLLVILVFVLMFFCICPVFFSYLSSWWFWYLSCCFLYFSCFFLHICHPGDFGICPVVFCICPGFFLHICPLGDYGPGYQRERIARWNWFVHLFKDAGGETVQVKGHSVVVVADVEIPSRPLWKDIQWGRQIEISSLS